jgi:hypothetical protein
LTQIHEGRESTPHLFTVEEYLTIDIPGRTELIEGVVYDVAPKNEPHILAVARLVKALNRGLSDEYIVRGQDPIAVAGWTGKLDPEIDVVVALDKTYPKRAVATDAFAFIEVSDTTYANDREVKIPLCVGAKVPTWHVNIPERQVEFYDVGADPNGAPTRVFAENEAFEILGVSIPVTMLFAPAP